MIREEQTLAMLHLAESAALVVGQSLKHRRSDWQSLRESSGHDVKIDADRRSEKLIIERLEAGSSIRIFSEESGRVGRSRGKGKNEKTGLHFFIRSACPIAERAGKSSADQRKRSGSRISSASSPFSAALTPRPAASSSAASSIAYMVSAANWISSGVGLESAAVADTGLRDIDRSIRSAARSR